MRLKIKFSWQKLASVAALFFIICSNTWAQPIVVKGTVTDIESGSSLPGVNVVIEGTQQGTITNIDGMYEITVPSGDVALNYSFIGFNSESVRLAGRTVIDVQLTPELTELDEVVVIGYGTMKKKDLTGSVASVRKDDIEANKSPNAALALQGRVTGLDITQSTGQAGAGMNITMRGARSITANNAPLILVDGVEYGRSISVTTTKAVGSADESGIEYSNSIDLNTDDIESIDVLKDAASTAIYGSKGANGVIIITTKKGQSDKTRVSYNMYFSHNSPAYLPHIKNGEEYQQKLLETRVADAENTLWSNQAIYYNPATKQVVWNQTLYPEPWNVFGSLTVDQLVANRGLADKYELINTDPVALDLMRRGVSLDYMDLLLRNSWSQNHEFSISGGSSKSTYNLSLGYLDDKGLLRRDEMKRYNVRVSVDNKLTKSLSIGASLLYTKKDYDRKNSSIFNQAMKAGPIGILYEPDGTTYRQTPDMIFAFNQYSPMLDEPEGAYINDVFNNTLFGAAYLSWEAIKGLTFRSNLGVIYTDVKDGLFASGKSLRRVTLGSAEAYVTHLEDAQYTWDNTLTYQKSMGIHNITLLAGTSLGYNLQTSTGMSRFGQPYDNTEYFDFEGLSDVQTRSLYEQSQSLSYFGRINYSLMNKYLFQASMRADGSSVLYMDAEKNNRWSSFPSASVGWRISEEEFMNNISQISTLKLRYSYGISGNSAVKPYRSKIALSNSANHMSLNGALYNQYVPYNPGNSDLAWERTEVHNFGLDFGLFKQRIYGNIEYYMSHTTDLLFDVLLPPSTSYTEITANVAETENKGVELSLTTVNIQNPVFDWTTDWGLAFNRNKILKLRGDVTHLPKEDDDEAWGVGQPVNTFYDLEVDGIYQISDLQAELLYVQQQQAAGDSINKAMIPLIANRWFPGDVNLFDKNLDGNYNVADKIYYNQDPKFILHFNNSMNLKTKFGKFGLSVQAIGRFGHTIAYDYYENYKTASDQTNGAYVDAWTPSNTGATFPRYSTKGNGINVVYYRPLKYIDGSFLKIRDITLSYTLPTSVTSKVKIDNIRVYASARNMLTFAKLKGWDPETEGNQNFPLAKQLFFGLNVNF